MWKNHTSLWWNRSDLKIFTIQPFLHKIYREKHYFLSIILLDFIHIGCKGTKILNLTFSGNTASVTQCSAGYYCTSGAYNSTPTDGTTGNICPMGRYCEVGSITGVGCPVGTFSNQAGLQSSSECTNCTGGYYCGSTGLTVETGLCHAGVY